MKTRQFLSLIRVPSLSATVVPALVGAATGAQTGRFDHLLWIIFLVVALLMQMATNVFNEHGDYVKGVDKKASHGFAGLIVTGVCTPTEILHVAVALSILAALIGGILVVTRGYFMLLLGLVSMLVGVTYSEGPLPLSGTPFGELLVGVVMGPVEVSAAELAASGTVTEHAYLYSIPVSLLVAAILLANNIRDLEKDRDAGRRTIPVLLGKRRATLLFEVVLSMAFIFTVLSAFMVGNPLLLLPLAASPIGAWGVSRIFSSEWKIGVEMTSMLYLCYGLLLASGIMT
ncbi:MAG: UbiA family prenyltransferase [Thermoprotei archaeon]